MSLDLDAKLYADFPLLYSARYAGTRDTLSHVGIETGGRLVRYPLRSIRRT